MLWLLDRANLTCRVVLVGIVRLRLHDCAVSAHRSFGALALSPYARGWSAIRRESPPLRSSSRRRRNDGLSEYQIRGIGASPRAGRSRSCPDNPLASIGCQAQFLIGYGRGAAVLRP